MDKLPFDFSLVARLVKSSKDPTKVLTGLAGLGINAELAASLLGVDEQTFGSVLHDNAKLFEAWQRGGALADGKVTAALYAEAIAGDVSACRFWLTHRRPEWADKPGAKRSGGQRPEQEQEPDKSFGGLKVVTNA